MFYWRIKVDHGKNICHDVYYTSAVKLSLENVPRNAVLDKYLIGVQLPFVTEIEEVPREEYCKYMWE